MFCRTDGTYCRLHPGTNSRGDAKPIYRSSPATGLATEQTSTGNDLTSLPANPYTYEDAVLVPQIDRMSKSEAYRLLQQTPCGPLAPEAHHFKWWLWICNIGNAREIIGCGIVAATLESKRAHCVQLLLTRSDNTEARLELRQHSHERYITIVPSQTPGHATEQTKDESATQQRAASSSGHATEQLLQAPPRPAPTREPPMPEGVASSSSAAPPQSPDEPIGETGRLTEACPEPIRLLEAGRVAEAEGRVLEVHMQRGHELEQTMLEAQQSFYKSLAHLAGASKKHAMNVMD